MTRSIVVGLSVLVGGSALGQSFNIDCGGTLGTPPSSSYGAGANQPGYWNQTYDGNLYSLNGVPTSVHFGADAGSAFHPIAGATGEDKLLMETTFDVGSGHAVTILNLAVGQYDVYGYAFGGAPTGHRTVGLSVWNGVNTVLGSVTFGTAWPGGQVEGETYAKMHVTVIPGQNFLAIYIGSQHDFDLLNGLQLVAVPVPGVSAVLLSAGVLAAGRRRRA